MSEQKNMCFEFSALYFKVSDLLHYAQVNSNLYWVEKLTPIRDLMNDIHLEMISCNLKEVEAIQKGELPKKTARQFLIEQIANKLCDRNDEALKRMDDSLMLDYDVRTKEEDDQYNKENEEFWKGK